MPRVDVLTGGFPCQDISNAGKRKGITGERSGLWKEYLKAISILRPKVVFAENVAALLGRGIDTVLCDLAEVGYDVEWHCLPASHVDAPHRRDRVFIIAYPCSYGFSESFKSTQRKILLQKNEKWNDETLLDTREKEQQFNSEQDGCVRHVADSYSATMERSKSEKRRLEQHRESVGREQWEVEPSVGRMVDGVSKGLDVYIWRERIKSLGNAVVPQCAQFFAERIKEKVNERKRNVLV